MKTILVFVLCGCAGAQSLRYRDTAILAAHTKDQHGEWFKITGVSGITWAGGEIFYAVMDNSDKVIKLQLKFTPNGEIENCQVLGGVTLDEKHDYEGIAMSMRDRAFISEEDTPSIHEFNLETGEKIRTLEIPRVYRQTVRNQGFESLTISPDGKSLWTANERALKLDGNTLLAAEPFGSATRVRLQRFAIDGEKITPAEQYEYDTSGVHEIAGQIGLCDLAALPDGKLLALERSGGIDLNKKCSIRTRIFLADLHDATDISHADPNISLMKLAPRIVKKRLLFAENIVDANGENLEGLCLGPQLGAGRFAVIGVVDDTDGPMHASASRVVTFEWRTN